MRLIQAPGIQTTELDRSGYADTTDNSIVNTASFFCGFTDKGIDYEKKYVNSMQTFERMFGIPTNEAERYLYNGVYETINRGGNAYVAKLPYDNEARDKFQFTKYKIIDELIYLSSAYDIVTTDYGQTGDYSLFKFMLLPNISANYTYTISEEGCQSAVACEHGRDATFICEQDNITFIEYFNKAGITLSVITDLFNDISETLNFKYSTRIAVKDIFYENGKYCRNDAVYMLSSLQDGICSLTAYGIEDSRISLYSDELEDIRSSIVNGGEFERHIRIFGQSKSLKYYRDYLHSIRRQVEDSRVEGYETQRVVLLNVIDEYDTEDLNTMFTELATVDSTLTSMMVISAYPQWNDRTIDIEDLDKMKIGTIRPPLNDIQIIEVSRKKYESEANVTDKLNPKEYLGILPVITTAANAMYFQGLIENTDDRYTQYCPLSSIQNSWSDNVAYDEQTGNSVSVRCSMTGLNNDTDGIVGFVQNIGGERRAYEIRSSTARTAVEMFPQILNRTAGTVERKYMKYIGIVVFEMSVDKMNGNRISIYPVESYVGNLDRNHVDEDTKARDFIDYVVNQRSGRINVFSNVRFSENQNAPMYNSDVATIFNINNQNATSLGFYSKDTLKTISFNESILKALDTIFSNASDINTFQFDILVDAGVSNIAQFIRSVYGNSRGYFNVDTIESSQYNKMTEQNTQIWKTVLQKYDNFCKNIRKDCMFIADGMRTLCLNGNQKRVRNTSYNNTVENTILKDIQYMSGTLNTSYGAGYCNWFYCIDKYSGNYFWCPPSIKANGIYIYTDAYSAFWNAPAGVNRGRLPQDVVDIAFNPTQDQSGRIYNNQWNYSIQFPIYGIILEGQRTFQTNKTSLDRVNVRRLLLGIEKQVRYISRFFLYEGLTENTMMRFKDSVSSIMENAKNKGGILEYYVICDGRNNNSQTIDNNELHCLVAIKPTKSIEFICLTFISTSQGVNVKEVAESEL